MMISGMVLDEHRTQTEEKKEYYYDTVNKEKTHVRERADNSFSLLSVASML